MPWAFGGTRMALDHPLNTLPLPPLLSITFVPSAFYAYVWHILEGTSKACIFSRQRE